MLVIICGQKSSGKSVALEILSQAGYFIFSTDQWIHEMYQYNETGYNLIKNKLGSEFVDLNEVDRSKLRAWIKEGVKTSNDENQNLIKLNNLTIPLIKRKMVELHNLYAKNIIFVELPIYVNHAEIFKDVCDAVIYIRRNDLTDEEGSAASYLKRTIDPKWQVVDNNSTITDYKQKLIAMIDSVIKINYKKNNHITEKTSKITN